MAIRDYMSKPSSGVKAGNRGEQARAGGAGDMVGQKRKRDEAAAAKRKAAEAAKKKAAAKNLHLEKLFLPITAELKTVLLLSLQADVQLLSL